MQAMQLLLDFGANVDFTNESGLVAEGGAGRAHFVLSLKNRTVVVTAMLYL